ncbi:MAG: HDIG domain-containing protein [Candidatus Melainabacteria bacterium]|nr:HDIG domain-containing protein [Candidatus Melainabacteria bacterium]
MALFPKGLHPLEQKLNLQIFANADRAGATLYLVGGYLRDALLGLHGTTPKDLDYAVAGTKAITFARQIAENFQGHYVLLDEGNDTARVVLGDGTTLDFAGCLGQDITTDIARRDFTVNALAWNNAQPHEILDFVGGQKDLEQRTVRAISESNFLADPLRLLRAFRIAVHITGTIDGDTLKMISRHAHLLKDVAPERISYELFLVMSSCAAGWMVKQMGDTGILEVIFPELTATRNIPPNAYHHLGLWDHSLVTIAEAEKWLCHLPEWVADDLHKELATGVSRLAATKIACLLHDIGKPDTWEITSEGRHTFYGHDRLGSEMTQVVATRLRWARGVERLIVKLVQWHLRPGQLFHQGQPTQRALHRFYRLVGQDLPALMLVAFGDLGATKGPGLTAPARDLLETSLTELLQRFIVFLEGEHTSVAFLDGYQVMKLLAIEPGPIVGVLLEALAEAQSLSEISSRAEAERFVIAEYKKRYCN